MLKYVCVSDSISFNMWCVRSWFFFFQAEDGIRDLVRSRGLGDVYKRQPLAGAEVDQRWRAARGRRTVVAGHLHDAGERLHLSLIHI